MTEKQNKFPAMMFYPQDFLSDINVQSMSNEQLGCYIKLLCVCWIQGGELPNDDQELSDILGVKIKYFEKHLKKKIKKVFVVDEKDNSIIYNPRIKKDQKTLNGKAEHRSKVAKDNASKRWDKKKDDATGIDLHCKQDAKPIPTECKQNANDMQSDAISISSSISIASSISLKEKSNKKESGSSTLLFVEEFKDIWSTYRGFCKIKGSPVGDRKKAESLYSHYRKTIRSEEIKQAIVNYSEDCLLRSPGFRHLTTFLSKDKESIIEWKDGSDNHKELLEMKSKPKPNFELAKDGYKKQTVEDKNKDFFANRLAKLNDKQIILNSNEYTNQ